MTNNEDIRPGNQVNLKTIGLPVTITEVEQKSISLESFPECCSYLKEDINGIPLTVHMLRDLDFNNDKTINTWRGQGVTIHLKEDGIFYGLRLLRNRTKIQYLHQLQNYITDFYAVFKGQEKSLLMSDTVH